MQPVPKACLRHRLEFLPGTLGHEYKAVVFFLSQISTAHHLPPVDRRRPPSPRAHRRIVVPRFFLSALGLDAWNFPEPASLRSDLYISPSSKAARNSSPILAVDPSASTLLPFPGPGEHPRVPLFPHDPPAPRFPHWNPSNTLRRRCAATPSRPHRRTPRSEPSRAQMSPQVDHVCRSRASEPNLRPNQALDR